MKHLVDISNEMKCFLSMISKLFSRRVGGSIFCFANFLKKVFTLFFYFKNFDVGNNDVNFLDFGTFFRLLHSAIDKHASIKKSTNREE